MAAWRLLWAMDHLTDDKLSPRGGSRQAGTIPATPRACEAITGFARLVGRMQWLTRMAGIKRHRIVAAVILCLAVTSGSVAAFWLQSAPLPEGPVTRLALGSIDGVIYTKGGWLLTGREVALERTEEVVAVVNVDSTNRFQFEDVPADDGYFVRLVGIDPGPHGPCVDPLPFSVEPGATVETQIACWR